jgi:hypothetical protein
MFDDGKGDMGFIAGDMPGIDIDGEGGGGRDIGVDGDELECLTEPLRLCFLYLTCCFRNKIFFFKKIIFKIKSFNRRRFKFFQ